MCLPAETRGTQRVRVLLAAAVIELKVNEGRDQGSVGALDDRGVSIAAPHASELPSELRPKLPFSDDHILVALPDEGRFSLEDLRWPWSRG